MKRFCFVVFAILLHPLASAQAPPGVTATSSGTCSPPHVGSNNTYNINCSGIGKKQAAVIIELLNEGLKNQDVNAKLAELLKVAARKCPLTSGDDIYAQCSDAEVGDFVIAEAENMRTMASDPWYHNGSGGDGFENWGDHVFTRDYRKCCLERLKALHAVLISRLQGGSYDQRESDFWAILIQEEKYDRPMRRLEIREYASSLEKLGLRLKRRGIPPSPPVVLKSEEMPLPQIAQNSGGVTFPYRTMVTITGPSELDSGYIAIVFDGPFARMSQDFAVGRLASPEDIRDKQLAALWGRDRDHMYLLKIGDTPFFPAIPIHVLVEASSAIHVVGATWFDE